MHAIPWPQLSCGRSHRVVKPLLLDEGSVFENGAKPIDGTSIHKPSDVVSGGQGLAGPTPLGRKFLPFARHIDLGYTWWWYQSEHLLTQTKTQTPSVPKKN